MKGLGFFAGGLLLQVFGFHGALWLMAALIAAILLMGLLSLPRELGKAKASKTVEGAVRKIPPGQSARCGTRVSIRRPRRVVRGRSARLFSMSITGPSSRSVRSSPPGPSSTASFRPRPAPRSPDGLSREVPGARPCSHSDCPCPSAHCGCPPPRFRRCSRPCAVRLCIRRSPSTPPCTLT